MASDQFLDPQARRVVCFALVTAVAIIFFMWLIIGALLSNTAFFSISWLNTIVNWFGGLATVAITCLLFPAAISVAIGLNLEKIANAVERRHYPHLAPAILSSNTHTLLATFRFLFIMVSLNLLLLPFLLIGPLFPFVFYSINGYLLSREYFEMVALRRKTPHEASALRKKNTFQLFLVGVFVAFMLTVPVVNIFAPIIATGMMVHLFEDYKKRA